MNGQESSSMSGDEEEQNVRALYDGLCEDLNMDNDSKSEAWASYLQISRTYTLEGNNLHWLVCALHVACRNSCNTTKSASGRVMGNGVSLTALLKAANFSLLEFFQKVRKWLEMAKCSIEFRKRIELLERNFSVSSCIYKKFEPIFNNLFQKAGDVSLKSGKGRKRKLNQNFLESLKRFCWILYVRVKGNFPGISDDLVNSYHLLLCCLDLIYLNCVTSNHHKETLNPKFKDLPPNYMNKDLTADDVPCLVDSLCRMYDGIVLESKQIRQHHWKPFMKTLFENKILKGNKETLTGLLEPSTFENNLKHVNQDYDSYVISVGDFDERVFLGPNFSQEIGTPVKSTADDDIDHKERFHLRRNLAEHFNRATSLVPETPLTGRGYLCEKDPSVSPISTATQSINQLQNLLQGCGPFPSESLKTLFSECRRNPKERIAKLVQEIGSLFIERYTKPLDREEVQGNAPVDFAKERLRLASTLFYKVLESILVSEKKRMPDTTDFTALLEQDIFIKCLAASCLEVVVFAYNSQREFPWILDILQLKPFYFYKVIEILIREEDGLSRDVVKHMNYIEERVLEKLAWELDSPLYDALKHASYIVPSCENSTFSNPTPFVNNSILSTVTPVTSPVVTRQGAKQLNGSGKKVTQPNTDDAQPSVAKRNLFGTMPSNSGQTANSQNISIISPKKTGVFSPTKGSSVVGTLNVQGQTILLQQSKGLQGIQGPVTWVVPYRVSPNTTPVNSPVKGGQVQGTPKKAGMFFGSPTKSVKKTGSLGLFFRKVYHMASVRLGDLSTKLGIDAELQKKIWTCFEYSLVHKIHMMHDRHLDQLLMCAVYVMSKVTKQDKKFHDIMRCYRTQPQAVSDVYRHVLVKKGKKVTNDETSQASGSTSAHGHSSEHLESSGLKSVAEDSSEPRSEKTDDSRQDISSANVSDVYGDLIEFYNSVYIKEIKDFALRFAPNGKSQDAPPLSPLPVRRKHLQSPRKVSRDHEIYVSPIKPPAAVTPSTRILYCFDKSPSKAEILQSSSREKISQIIYTGQSTIERTLDFFEPENY